MPLSQRVVQICLWAAITVRRQDPLVYLIAVAVFLGGVGRLVSISQVGLPQPAAVWLGYLIPELVLPYVVIAAHAMTKKRLAATT
jgi:hypothetical protein